MTLTPSTIRTLSAALGDSFYILDSNQFQTNYRELLAALKKVYVNAHISYSYKTNYIPRLCRLIDALGGHAEVVSEMEYRLARRVGVDPSRIIFNGPYKTETVVEELLVNGGLVNIDARYELDMIRRIALRHPEASLKVALRCNFDIGDGVLSRFGFDTASSEFGQALADIRHTPNLVLYGLHGHFATRRLESFHTRAVKMLALIQLHFAEPPAYISLGGGLFGKMENSLAQQFEVPVPSYEQYAEALGTVFAEAYSHLPLSKQPALFIEPGSAIVGDCMKFVAKVINIKQVRGKAIATVTGSKYNINPTGNQKNPPLQVIHAVESDDHTEHQYSDLDFGGYTCIESDYLYRHYNGPLAVGDSVVFSNVGSYSVVLKPPFILPNFPIVEFLDGAIKLIKRQETQEDIFATYIMDGRP